MAAEIVGYILAVLSTITAGEKAYLFYAPENVTEICRVIIRHRDITACIILVGMVILPFPRHRFTSTVFIGFLRPTTFLYSIPEKNVSSPHSRGGVTSCATVAVLLLQLLFVIGACSDGSQLRIPRSEMLFVVM